MAELAGRGLKRTAVLLISGLGTGEPTPEQSMAGGAFMRVARARSMRTACEEEEEEDEDDLVVTAALLQGLAPADRAVDRPVGYLRGVTHRRYDTLLETLDEETWEGYFRFTKAQFLRLLPLLFIPTGYIHADSGCVWLGGLGFGG
jgi:hypothetical protein